MTPATPSSTTLSDTLDDTAWMNPAERALFDRACALRPTFAATEASTRAAREVPAENIEALRAANLFRILQPKRFGGLQGRTRLFSRVVEELTFGCSSTGWVYAVFGEHQWVIASFPEQAQTDVWGENPDAVASSSVVPRAMARKVPGGFRLSGRYPFSSGCGHAPWAVVGAFCQTADGGKTQRFMLAPMTDLRQIDDWSVLGLEGTGSRSLLFEDVFIPEHRTVLLDDLMRGTPPGCAVHPDFPILRGPRGMYAPFSQPPVVLTLARRLLALVTEMVKTRVSRAVTKVSDSEIAQLKLAESAAEVELATRLFQWRRERADALIMSGEPIPPMEPLATRRDIGYAHRLVRNATERLGELAGASFVYDSSPLQPILRDIQVCLTHGIGNYEGSLVPYGRALLGLDAAVPA